MLGERAQTSTEYVMLIGGAVLVSVIIVTLVLNLTNTSKGGLQANRLSYREIIEQHRPA